MKKFLALLLALTLCCGALAGCNGENKPADDPAPEKIVEDDGVMKILLIGHSLGVDSAFMFPDVARNEGMENLVFGFLYHSGCLVAQHVDYAKKNARQYAYYEYDISRDQEWFRADCNGNFTPCPAGAANDIYIEDGSIAQTLQFGIQRHDWDMVILQAGSGESANRRHASQYYAQNPNATLPGYIQELMDYVNENDVEKQSPTKFSWNMVWSSPKDPAVRRESTNQMLQTEYGGSEYAYYQAMSDTLQELVIPTYDWQYIFPAGTTMQNLKSTKLPNAELYRDYAHATDFGRLCVAYTWYCTLTDTPIEDCKIPPMNHKVLLNIAARNTGKDLVLTEEQMNILLECVGNALKNPYAMTQSQYTD